MDAYNNNIEQIKNNLLNKNNENRYKEETKYKN